MVCRFHGQAGHVAGSAPFAIVPYHRPHPGPEPPAPEHCYKDGIDIRCGGTEFRALKHFASNSGQWVQNTSMDAGVDTEAVVVDNEAADDFNPAALVISAKFQCGWYQYVHSWEFAADGCIHPKVAMGGQLNPFTPSTAHLHNFYFRIDLDIDGQFPHDVVEVFNHNSLNDPGGDKWKVVTQQGKLLANPQTARKWRIRNTIREKCSRRVSAMSSRCRKSRGVISIPPVMSGLQCIVATAFSRVKASAHRIAPTSSWRRSMLLDRWTLTTAMTSFYGWRSIRITNVATTARKRSSYPIIMPSSPSGREVSRYSRSFRKNVGDDARLMECSRIVRAFT